jgi:hypothetical protein
VNFAFFNIDVYVDLMMRDVQEYNKDVSKQEKTPEQVANWVNGNEIKEIWDEEDGNWHMGIKPTIY